MKRKVIALAAVAVALIQLSNTSATVVEDKNQKVETSSPQLTCDELAKRLTVANSHIYMQHCM